MEMVIENESLLYIFQLGTFKNLIKMAGRHHRLLQVQNLVPLELLL
jgi:hypothetical protein